MEALLELKGRQLVEPALEEIATTVAAFLPELPMGARVGMLRRLWPLIAQLPSATERMTAFALAWQVRCGGLWCGVEWSAAAVLCRCWAAGWLAAAACWDAGCWLAAGLPAGWCLESGPASPLPP
jgi:hypothetical protein